MKVRIYVEGGGYGRIAVPECREGFRRLLERAGFTGRMPAVMPCGPRSAAFDDFSTALRRPEPNVYPILLVDSESPVNKKPWEHLKAQDGWDRPNGVEDEQAQLMVQCMETWIVADPEAVRRFFGHDLQANALPPTFDLEKQSKDDVQEKLEHATRNCDQQYRKGKQSFDLLAKLHPAELKRLLPHFRLFCRVLHEKL